MPEYSENFKRKMVQRMTRPHPISATALSREVGVSQATLSRWLLAAGTIGPMSKKTTLHERTPARAEERKPEDKLRMVVEAARLSDEELGAFLRREGLHESDLAAWRESMLGALKPATNKHVRSVEVQIGKAADLLLRDAGLLLPGEGLEGPLVGQPRSLDPPLERRLLGAVPLGTKDTREKVLVARVVLLRELELVVEDLRDAFETQGFE
jgi:transposase-like protein